MSSGWKQRTFHVKVSSDNGPRDRSLRGWVKGHFALDTREYWNADFTATGKGWVISHLPTGHGVRAVKGPLQRARIIADAIAALGDWGFTNPAAGKAFGKGVKAVMLEHPECVSAEDFLRPSFADFEYPEEAA